MSNSLLEFLAHAIELESEAHQRYAELADAMATHNNPAVANFFREMAVDAAKHLAEVRDYADGECLPSIKPWDFHWAGEAPESASYEALHYRMSLREATELARENERSARDWYAGVADTSSDPATIRLAMTFAEEESGHVRCLDQRLKDLPMPPVHARQDDDPPHVPE